MYDWILEANLHRYRRALWETRDDALRERIGRFIALTERRLIKAGRTVTRPKMPSIGWPENGPSISDQALS